MNKNVDGILAGLDTDILVAMQQKVDTVRLLNESGLPDLLTSSGVNIVNKKLDHLFPATAWEQIDPQGLLPKIRGALENYLKAENASSKFAGKLPVIGESYRKGLIDCISDNFEKLGASQPRAQKLSAYSFESKSLPGIEVHMVQNFERNSIYQVILIALFSRKTEQALQKLLNKNGLCTQFVKDRSGWEKTGFWSIGSGIFHGFRESGNRDKSEAFALGYYASSNRTENESGAENAGLIALSLFDSFA